MNHNDRHLLKFIRICFLYVSIQVVFIMMASYGVANNKIKDEPAAEVKVRIHEKSEIAGDQIVLSAIADISAPPVMKKRIGDISFGRSPDPGQEKVMYKDRIKRILSYYKWLPENTIWEIPDKITIVIQSQTISTSQLENLYKTYISEKLKGSPYNMSKFSVRGPVHYPMGDLTLKIMDTNKYQTYEKNVNFKVVVYVDGKESGRIILTAWIDRFNPMIFVKQDMMKHNIIKPEDVYITYGNTANISGNFCSSLNEVVGMRLKQTISANSVLRANLVEISPIVKKGDQVKMIAQKGVLRVSTLGIAKEDGAMGEQIKVENVKTNKVVSGKVISNTSVEIPF
ncbi:MAG: flagellar basal body P-ring formation protein FlgA [Desulfobacterales bacterium]|nr:flagellar basal body P-ring formation protein FlgA [Desulfobacterales bacterium]